MKKVNLNYLWFIPMLIPMMLFLVIPLLQTLELSMWSEVSQIYKVKSGFGFGAFAYVLSDPIFIKSVLNTIILIIITVPLVITISFIFAYILNKNNILRNLINTLFFIPYILPTIAIAYSFFMIFDYNDGIMNWLLNLFNLGSVSWIKGDPGRFVVLTIFVVVSQIPFITLMMLNAINKINPDKLNLSKISGDNWIKTSLRVIVPQIKSTLIFLTFTTIVFTFKIYASVSILFQGTGELDNVSTIVLYIVEHLRNNRWNYGAAASILLLIMITILTLVRTKFVKRKVRIDNLIASKIITNRSRKIFVSSIIITTLMLLPLLLMVYYSFTSNGSFTMSNFTYVFDNANVMGAIINTTISFILQTIIILFTSICAAYGITNLRKKEKNIITNILYILMAVPVYVVITQNYINLSNYGFKGTMFGLIAPYLFSSYFTLMLVRKFDSIGKDTKNMSIISGDSKFTYFKRILIPASKRTIQFIVILKLFSTWNQYLWPNLINDDQFDTVGTIIRSFSKSSDAILKYRMTVAFIMSVPIIVVYAIFNKLMLERR